MVISVDFMSQKSEKLFWLKYTMKKNFLLFCCIISFIQVSAQKIDVFIIGGQSNATGQGYVRNIPNSFQLDTTVLFYYSRFLNNAEGGDTWQPLCQASETKDKFGVELSMGTKLHALFPERKIALIKHALSGSNLYEQWNPGNRPGEFRGAEYDKFIKTVKEGLAKLVENGYTPVLKAMVWQQGEADARDIAGLEQSYRYGINLKNFIGQLRKDLNSENMLFVYGSVMPLAAERFIGRDFVRSAQIAVSESSQSDLSVKNAVWVYADDLQMRRTDYHTPYPEDDVHLGTYGILTLGERFADTIFNVLISEIKEE